MKIVKRTDEERQQALDWLKDKIRPRLKYAKGPVRLTEEQLDSITISTKEPNSWRLEHLFRMVWYNWVYDSSEICTIKSPMMGNEAPLIEIAPEYDDPVEGVPVDGFTFMELLAIIFGGQDFGFSFLFNYNNVLAVTIYEFDNYCYLEFYSAAKQLGYHQEIFEKAYQERQATVETLEKLNKK